MPQSFQKLQMNQDDFIAYQRIEGDNSLPGVIFLGGFMSDMTGTKAEALAKFCQEQGWRFTRFDYMGHGKSSRAFTDGTIGLWKENVLSVLDTLTEGKQILVGSSMGGWLMLLAALARPERVAALVGVASAPDFTEELIWRALPPFSQRQLLEKGHIRLGSPYNTQPYPVTKALVEEGRNHLLLGMESIPLHMPVRLIHGEKDDDVPSSVSKRLYEKLVTMDKHLTLVANGDHRMSSEEDIALILRTVEGLMPAL